MRRVLTMSVVVALAGACVAAAVAATSWPQVHVHASVWPSRAGTRRHPRGVHLRTVIRWPKLGATQQPIVTGFHLLFPRGSLYRGAHYKTCSVRRMNRRGPRGCPKASIMGYGSGTAYADRTITYPKITVINGGAHRVYFYTVLNNPARVQEPVVGKIARRSGRWAYSLTVNVPKNLQVVAGVPIELTYLQVHAGRGSWLATTGCWHHRWPFFVKTSYLDPDTGARGASSYTSSVRCRPHG